MSVHVCVDGGGRKTVTGHSRRFSEAMRPVGDYSAALKLNVNMLHPSFLLAVLIFHLSKAAPKMGMLINALQHVVW